MADGEPHELIIIRRAEEEAHEHHSSAWKVAHADFMTAMMAFFLIMWLVNVTDDEMRKGISEYFNPIHLSQGETELKGLNQPVDGAKQQSGKGGHSDATPPAFNPMQLSQGAADAKTADKNQAAAAAAAVAAVAASQTAAAKAVSAGAPSVGAGTGGPASGAGQAAAGAAASGAGASADAGTGAAAGAAPAPGTAAGEQAAFQDPYAVLAKLAAAYAKEHPASTTATAGDDRPVGAAGGDVDRDPFDPAYWQLSDGAPARADKPASPTTATAPPTGAVPDAGASLTPPAVPPPSGAGHAAEAVAAGSASPPVSSAMAPPAASVPPTVPPAELSGAGSLPPAPVAEAEALSRELKVAVSATGGAAAAPVVSVNASPEGILVDLTDDSDFSMFEVGSAVPNPEVVVLLAKVAKALATRPGDVVVRGYTDSRPFHSDVYDNWRLSAARAHMAYYMLVSGGLDEQRIASIEGFADRSLKNPADPLAAENRRIEILLKAAP